MDALLLSPREPSYPTPTSPGNGNGNGNGSGSSSNAMEIDGDERAGGRSPGTPPRPSAPTTDAHSHSRPTSQPTLHRVRSPPPAHSHPHSESDLEQLDIKPVLDLPAPSASTSAAPSPRASIDRKPFNSNPGSRSRSPSSSGASTPVADVKPKGVGRGRKKVKKEEPEPQLVGDLPIATDQARRTFTELDECTYASKALGNVKVYADEDMDLAVCDCSYDPSVPESEQSCGDDSNCVNRLLQIECLPEDCRCGGRCQNQRFQKRDYAPIDIIKTDKKGFGVRARVDMIADTFVYEYVGEVIGPVVFARKMKEYATDGIKHFYFMALDKDIFIDATKKGGLGRFLNHSCNPNCVVAKWTIGKKMRMGIFTKRDLKANEELTFNYNVDRYGHTAQECYCGEPNCVGFIGGKTQTDIGGMDDLYLDALGITDEVEALGLRGTKTKKGKQLDDDFIPLLKPIELDEVPKVAAAVRQALTTKRILEKLLIRINMTHAQEVQRQLLRLHGFNLMSHILKEYPKDVSVIILALEVLSNWPLVARNKVESSKIESPVKLCAEMEDEPAVVRLAQGLLADWDSLEFGYRIPKSLKDASKGDRKRDAELSIDSLAKRSRPSEPTTPSLEARRPEFIKPVALERSTSTALPSVPAGWSVSRDERAGRLWYKNLYTGEATREPPTHAATPVKVAPLAPDVNSIIARVEAEAAAKTAKAVQDRLDEDNARKAKAKSSAAAVKDKKVLNLFSAIVVGVMSKYKQHLEPEQFKKRARELTTILCDKEKKHPNYHDEPYDRLSPEKAAKVKAFAKDWVKKLIERHGAGSGAAKLVVTPLTTTPSPSTTPHPEHPSMTPATPRPGAHDDISELVSSSVPKAVTAGDTPPGTPPPKKPAADAAGAP